MANKTKTEKPTEKTEKKKGADKAPATKETKATKNPKADKAPKLQECPEGYIRASEIYGFSEALAAARKAGDPEAFALVGHKNYPQPRTVFTDESKSVVESVVAAKGQPHTHLTVYEETTDEPLILVDGFTRMTGVGQYHTKTKVAPENIFVPANLSTLDGDAIYDQMARVNFERANLSDIDRASRMVGSLKRRGIKEIESPEATAVFKEYGYSGKRGTGLARKICTVMSLKWLRSYVEQSRLTMESATVIVGASEDDAERKNHAKNLIARASEILSKDIESANQEVKRTDLKKGSADKTDKRKSPPTPEKATKKATKELKATLSKASKGTDASRPYGTAQPFRVIRASMLAIFEESKQAFNRLMGAQETYNLTWELETKKGKKTVPVDNNAFDLISDAVLIGRMVSYGMTLQIITADDLSDTEKWEETVTQIFVFVQSTVNDKEKEEFDITDAMVNNVPASIDDADDDDDDDDDTDDVDDSDDDDDDDEKESAIDDSDDDDDDDDDSDSDDDDDDDSDDDDDDDDDDDE